MERMKAACEKVLEKASSLGVRFPKTWAGEEEKKNKMKAAFELLSSTDKTSDGEFNVDAVVEKLGEKFGLESKAGEKRKAGPEEEDASDNSADVKDDSGGGGSPKPKKKSKKIPEEMKKKNIFVVEENRDFGSQLQEISDLYYKAGEARKGGTFQGREGHSVRLRHITTTKEAMALPGVGKGMAAYLSEFRRRASLRDLKR